MKLSLKYDLPFVALLLAHKNSMLEISDVLVDTGSASTILSADALSKLGIVPAPEDTLYSIRGVGGSEVVFARKLDYLQVGERRINDFEIEVGGMDYGFDINGILGTDFLLRSGARIDLSKLEIEFVAQ
jgi:hypothetical protein